MDVIDKILLEWSYRCSDGIVDMNDPIKKAILDDILKETGINKNVINEESSIYDSVISKIFKGEIPQAKGKYVLGNTTKVNSEDLPAFKQLYPVSPPKAGKDIDTAGSKGSGNGEIAIYWLFQHQSSPVDSMDTRGAGAPDLRIGGKGVEIKAYDSARMTLGRVGSDHENVSLLNTIFGLHSLVTSINKNDKVEKQHSSLNFTKKGIIEAFTSFVEFNSNQELRALSEKYPLIKNIYDKVDDILMTVGDGDTTPEDLAASLIKRLLLKKTAEKPGFGGYLLNVNENGDLKWTQITKEKIMNLDSSTVLDNVFLNQGMLIMNPDKLFQ
jgi:hypothetical protein